MFGTTSEAESEVGYPLNRFHITEALPGVWGNRGTRAFISGEQEEQMSNFEQGNKDNIGEQGT